MNFVPPTSYGRAILGGEFVANNLILTLLFSILDIVIQFLQYVGLFRSCILCSAAVHRYLGA